MGNQSSKKKSKVKKHISMSPQESPVVSRENNVGIPAYDHNGRTSAPTVKPAPLISLSPSPEIPSRTGQLRAISTPKLQARSNSMKTILIAVYSYEARADDELSFAVGDRMEMIGESENSDWCLARHEQSGREGFIPRNYTVMGTNSVRGQEWWCPVDRGDAERTLLNPELGRGTFLIRERQDTACPFAISVKDYKNNMTDYEVKHYKIRTIDKGGFYITHAKVFKTMAALVQYYSENPDAGLCCRLSTPCPKTKPFVPFREMEVSANQIKLIRKVGDGYFGEVWIGKMKNYENVAVKMMKRGKMSAQNFIKEAKVLHNLRHPKLVPLRGVCTRTFPMMIITELMVKGDLLNYLHNDAGRKLRLPHLIDMASQVASGMSYLEKCNYIHRDLRAANVLVGDNNIVKIADFGLARLVLNEDDIYIMSNGCKVPIKWTAPEALFHREFSTKSDVWSFGVLLYEIFTYGRVPYPCMTSAELGQLLQTGYRMSKPNVKGFPDAVYKTMLKCWKEIPDSRPTFSFLHAFFEDYITSSEGGYKEAEQT